MQTDIDDSNSGYQQLYWQEIKDAVFRQYTGLKDKNGKEIYEGDIVTGKRDSHWHDGYEKVYAKVYFSDSNLGFMVDGMGGGYLHDIEDIEVIGNVFEHPELLEVKEGESHA
ncbi:hypothetical protein AM501_27420 [Aneurinibacillus migulanus]|nr:hypothetical protein AM501_27420 [Aneurinibacillus migulanus]